MAAQLNAANTDIPIFIAKDAEPTATEDKTMEPTPETETQKSAEAVL